MRWLCLAVALTAPIVPGCKCSKEGGTPAPTAAPAAPSAAVEAKPEIVRAELKQNASTLRVTLRISPQINGRLDPKIALYEVHLGAAAKPKTNGRVGPALKPIAEAAQLTADEAQKLLAWLDKPDALKGVTTAGGTPESQRHATITLGWDATPSKYVVTLPWGPEASAKLDAIRDLLSDDHKKLVEALSKPVPR